MADRKLQLHPKQLAGASGGFETRNQEARLTTDRNIPQLKSWTGMAIATFVLGLLFGRFAENLDGAHSLVLAENGLVEAAQLIALALAIALYVLRFRRSQDAIGAICIGVTILLVIASLREIPRCDSYYYEGGLCLNRAWKRTFTGIGLVSLLAMAYPQRERLREASRSAIIPFWPLALSAMFLLVADGAERLHFQGVEEFMELGAYSYTTAHASWLLRRT